MEIFAISVTAAGAFLGLRYTVLSIVMSLLAGSGLLIVCAVLGLLGFARFAAAEAIFIVTLQLGYILGLFLRQSREFGGGVAVKFSETLAALRRHHA
jgi:hypothetical protein